MTLWNPASEKQLMECLAAFHVAEHARGRWRLEFTNMLIEAAKQLPSTADATPLIDIAHGLVGDFWSPMRAHGAAPSDETGIRLRPQTALEALRQISGQVMVDVANYVPGHLEDGQIAALRQMSEHAVGEKTLGYRESVEMRDTQIAQLACQIRDLLAATPGTSTRTG